MDNFVSEIRASIIRDHYLISDHARQRMNQRGIGRSEVLQTILYGEVVEQTPNASPHPKCLFINFMQSNRPLYVACGYNSGKEYAIIITVHWFDPDKWFDWYTRRR
ncbi:MAG: DUF4258 domain-containing protein [Candidatus Latescibacteria bacterium]|jgi:hypothetical protein|nr:DUF4258 domain-containing protein [Candidatus Latescibacterota bacterium]